MTLKSSFLYSPMNTDITSDNETTTSKRSSRESSEKKIENLQK